MESRQLPVYFGPDDTLRVATRNAPRRSGKVTVPISDVLAPLMDAVSNRRVWLQDFENDEITISSDLYEVILAYQCHSLASA